MGEIRLRKSKRVLEWAIAFWIGAGLMSMINVIKLIYTQHAVIYSWIMFGVSVIFIAICAILVKIER